jgi:hypothetical protein
MPAMSNKCLDEKRILPMPNGLLRGGFVPSVNFRELRLVSRQMQKLTGMLSREKNRLHNESADKKKTEKARKGNPYVRRILCEAANAARRTRCSLQDKFKGLMLRRGKKRAIFAIFT